MEDEDEYSWPRRMIPRRHSMEDHHHRRSRRSSDRLIIINDHRDEDDPTINHGVQVLDFRDVFGGAPQSVMPIVHSSGDSGITTSSSTTSRSTSAFYNGIFCHTTHRSNHHRGTGRRRGGIFHDDSIRMRSNNNSIGRNLPGFNIPSLSSSPSSSASMPAMPGRRPSSSSSSQKAGLFMEEGFYDDIFRSEHGSFGRRDGKPRFCSSCKTKLISKSKSKTTSSSAASILSSEDIQIHSDLHSNINDDILPVAAHHNNLAEDEDVVLSSFTSKLRPITMPTRTTHYEPSSPQSTISGSDGDSSGGHRWAPMINLKPSSLIDLPSSSEIERSCISTDSFQQYNCAKPASGDHGHRQYFVNESSHISKDFSAAVSPTSVTFSVFLQPSLARNAQVENAITEKAVVVQEDERNKAGGESSFIIEIDSNSHCVKSRREAEGAAALDEAIAWAKEKFWNQQLASDTAQ